MPLINQILSEFTFLMNIYITLVFNRILSSPLREQDIITLSTTQSLVITSPPLEFIGHNFKQLNFFLILSLIIKPYISVTTE